jgi:DNA repair protein RecO
MYSIRGIVLERKFFREKDVLYRIFSREYGKISVWVKMSSTRPLLDLGAVAKFTVQVKPSKNTCREYSVLRMVDPSGLDYERLKNFLDVVARLSASLPERLEYPSLFDDYLSSFDALLDAGRFRFATGVFLLRLGKLLGILPATDSGEPVVAKIATALDLYPIERVHAIRGVDDHTADALSAFVTPHFQAFAHG